MHKIKAAVLLQSGDDTIQFFSVDDTVDGHRIPFYLKYHPVVSNPQSVEGPFDPFQFFVLLPSGKTLISRVLICRRTVT
jgi:hypothetical protein